MENSKESHFNYLLTKIGTAATGVLMQMGYFICIQKYRFQSFRMSLS